jgi:hypothetical protein
MYIFIHLLFKVLNIIKQLLCKTIGHYQEARLAETVGHVELAKEISAKEIT